ARAGRHVHPDRGRSGARRDAADGVAADDAPLRRRPEEVRSLVLAVLLFGPPGAGKGTQAAAVAAASGMPHIATGDMFREHLRLGTPLGLEARGYLDSGALVPDDVTIGMLADRISQPDAAAGFVL